VPGSVAVVVIIIFCLLLFAITFFVVVVAVWVLLGFLESDEAPPEGARLWSRVPDAAMGPRPPLARKAEGGQVQSSGGESGEVVE
jgi:hypothetical protein